MTPYEYLHFKSSITEKHLGIKIVEDSRLKDIKATQEMVDDMHHYVDTVIEERPDVSPLRGLNCPYCAIYNESFADDINCTGCPMDTAGDNCFHQGSTYNKCVEVVEDDNFDRTEIQDELLAFAIQFVSAHKDLYDPHS